MKNLLLSCLLLTAALTVHARLSQLRPELIRIAQGAGGTVGVAIRHIESRDAAGYNDGRYFPMQSTFKFPIAMAVLDQVDAGKLRLGQQVRISKAEMVQDTWSPLRDKHPDGATVTVDELLSGMVSQSDNIACDALLRLIGGPAAANAYVHRIGIREMDIVGSEADMNRNNRLQYRNRCTPRAMLQLLVLFHQRPPLSVSSRDYLMRLMEQTTTGPKRLKGQLPAGTVVAHKTGTGNRFPNGITSATNDVGIITLPNGQHLAIAVFIQDAAADEAAREGVIAGIAAAAYRQFRK